jgi:hypothetical protein
LIPYHGTEAICDSSAVGQKENRNGKVEREECVGLHLLEGRLPVQSLHLQELQLLTGEGRVSTGGAAPLRV